MSQINALLVALALPFTLDDPTDLTPSLLLAIFESIISARLPIPPAIRQSRTRDAQSRAMLVLLGVLECDILRGGTDPDNSALTGAGDVSVDGWVDEIGLGEVDPERLADGGVEETIFIGELLCWLARRKGILPPNKPSHRTSHTRSLYSNYHESDSVDISSSLIRPSIPDDLDFSIQSHITDIPRHPLVHSPDPSFSASDLSIRARSVSSRTSLDDPHQILQDDDDRPPAFRPRCIHELADPSYIRAQSPSDHDDNDDPYAPPTPTPIPRRVRLTGWIEPVDTAAELGHFAASRARALNSSANSNAGPPLHASSRVTGTSFRSRPPRTPRCLSPSPSPPRPTTTSRHLPLFAPSPPPSPPTHSDPPFDVSFSTLNNTSTPAKPRLQRPLSKTSAGKTRHRQRSLSPPPFSALGRAPTRTVSPPGSTTVTSTLLTERARLLTELAALKRARVVSGGGGGGNGNSSVGRRVGIGV